MKIDGINMEDLKTIEFNYDNIGVLKCIKYLVGVVVNDIDYMNEKSEEIAGDYLQELDLGNNTYIKRDDLESLYSILDTINDIIDYNKDEVE